MHETNRIWKSDTDPEKGKKNQIQESTVYSLLYFTTDFRQKVK